MCLLISGMPGQGLLPEAWGRTHLWKEQLLAGRPLLRITTVAGMQVRTGENAQPSCWLQQESKTESWPRATGPPPKSRGQGW